MNARRLTRQLLIVGLLLALAAVLSPVSISRAVPDASVLAAPKTFTVNTTDDTVDANPGDGACKDASNNCSLRAAVMEANARAQGDTISLPAGDYLLTIDGSAEDAAATGDLDITTSLSIVGENRDSRIDANGIDRVLHITGTYTVALTGLTLMHGSETDGGGIYNNGGALTITNTWIGDNNASGSGGDIYNNSGTIIFADSFANWSWANYGGGIYNYAGTVTLERSVVLFHWIPGDGGAIYNEDGTVTLTDSTIDNVGADDDGGGIYNEDGTVTLVRSTVAHANASYGGGIYSAGSSAEVYITDSLFKRSHADSDGGHFLISGGLLSLENSLLVGGSANNGGGIYNDNGTVTITGSTLDDASGTNGGHLFNDGGIVSIHLSTFMQGYVGDTGGCIYNTDDGTVSISYTTLRDGYAPNGGGGIANGPLATTHLFSSLIYQLGTGGTGGGILNAGTMTVENSTISRNRSDSSNGGNIYNEGTLSVQSSTIVDGWAGSNGGGIYNSGGTATIHSSVLGMNNAGTSGPNCYGALTSSDYNLFADLSGCTITTQANDRLGSMDWTDVLFDNGGPTLTHSHIFRSSAHGNGDPALCGGTNVDQRGAPRTHCDIGAHDSARNLLANGFFEQDADYDSLPDGWSVSNAVLGDGLVPRALSYQSALRLNGSGTTKKLQQKVSASGSAGDSFTLSVWAAGIDIPSTPSVTVQLKYTDGTKETFTLPLASGTFDYQLFVTSFSAAKDYSSIKVQAKYSAGSGTLLLDDMWLAVIDL
jgi:CSLREA domain-containing protein